MPSFFSQILSSDRSLPSFPNSPVIGRKEARDQQSYATQVVLKLEYVSESPGELVQTESWAGFKVADSVGWVRPDNLHF